MTGYPWTAWLWWIGGAALGSLGLWLLYWSLLRDRSKGRRRCPKCWYNMSGTDSMTCSECGRTAKREKKLYKTHRRWRWAFAAILTGVLAGGSAVTPKVQRDGWISTMPSIVLIGALPWLSDPGYGGFPCMPIPRSAPGFNWLDRISHLSKDELMRRAKADSLWKWQWSWLIRKGLHGDSSRHPPSLEWRLHYGDFLKQALNHGYIDLLNLRAELDNVAIQSEVSVREAWPANVPIRVRAQFYNWVLGENCLVRVTPTDPDLAPFTKFVLSPGIIAHSDIWSDGTVDIGVPPSGIDQLEILIEFVRDAQFLGGDPAKWSGGTVFGEHRYTLPVKIGGSTSDLIAGYSSRAFDESLSRFLRASLSGAYLHLFWEDGGWFDIPDWPDDLAFAFVVELLHNGVVVGRTKGWAAIDFGTLYVFDLQLEGDLEAMMNASNAGGEWLVRLSGDAETALRCFECNTYWEGEIVVPAILEQDPSGEQELISNQSAELDDFLRKELRAYVHPRAADRIILAINRPPGETITDWPGCMSIEAQYEILADEQIVRAFDEFELLYLSIDDRGASSMIEGFDGLGFLVESKRNTSTQWSLHLRSKGLENWYPHGCKHYWIGEITIPLLVTEEAQAAIKELTQDNTWRTAR